MNTPTKTFKTAARAAIVTAILGAASLTAMPAQAQTADSFGFSFNAGNGFSFFIGGRDFDRDRRDHRRYCLDDRGIYRGLRAQGFDNIDIVGERRGRAIVEAERGRWLYTLRVDRCTGEIVVADRERIRRLPPRPWPDHSRDGGRAGFWFEIR